MRVTERTFPRPLLLMQLLPFHLSNYCTESLFILVQWEQNDGQCGVCGDAYNLRSPRPHEAGGEYGKGIISRRYAAGQVINPMQFALDCFENVFASLPSDDVLCRK